MIGPDATVTLDFALNRLAGLIDKLLVYPANMHHREEIVRPYRKNPGSAIAVRDELKRAHGWAENADLLIVDIPNRHGKRIWERHACINCHTILGEGAYFAPELGNVWVRYGGRENPEAARDALKAWIANQPTGIEGRRQMPNFHLSDQELNDLVDFLKWTSDIKTQDWPPNKAG